MIIEELYTLIQTDDVVQLSDIRQQCAAIAERMDYTEASCEFNEGSIKENKKNIDELHKSLKETMKQEKDTQTRMVACDE